MLHMRENGSTTKRIYSLYIFLKSLFINIILLILLFLVSYLYKPELVLDLHPTNTERTDSTKSRY